MKNYLSDILRLSAAASELAKYPDAARDLQEVGQLADRLELQAEWQKERLSYRQYRLNGVHLPDAPVCKTSSAAEPQKTPLSTVPIEVQRLVEAQQAYAREHGLTRLEHKGG